MLTKEETSKVVRLFNQIAESSTVTADDIARCLIRLPKNPESVSLLLQLARDRDLPARNILLGTIAHLQAVLIPAAVAAADGASQSQELERLLSSDDPYPSKVQLLIQCAKNQDLGAIEVVRRLLPLERNAFVLATMASFLGRLGDPSDGERLKPLLKNGDNRVVANSLEAFYHLKVPLDIERLTGLIEEREDPRVRTNALALLARSNPTDVLYRIEPMTRSDDAGTRSAVAHLLGQLGAHERAREILLDMLQHEDKPPVLKLIAQALKHEVSPRISASIIGPLYAIKTRAAGAKLAMLNMLLHEVGIEVGWIESQIVEAGRVYLVTQGLTDGEEAIGSKQLEQPEKPPQTQSIPETPEPNPTYGQPAVTDTVRLNTADLAATILELDIEESATAQKSAAGRNSKPGREAGAEQAAGTAGRRAGAPTSIPTGPASTSGGGVTNTLAPPPDAFATMRINIAEELDLEEDLPLSFSSVWGTSQKKSAFTDSGVNRIQKGKDRSGQVAGSETSSGDSLKKTLGGVAVLATFLGMGVYMKLTSTTAAPPPSTPVQALVTTDKRSKTSLVKPDRPDHKLSLNSSRDKEEVSRDDFSDAPTQLGPTGASVDVEGIVVSRTKGRMILRSGGRYYLIKGDRESEDTKVGNEFRAKGKVAGIARNGLVFVDVGS